MVSARIEWGFLRCEAAPQKQDPFLGAPVICRFPHDGGDSERDSITSDRVSQVPSDPIIERAVSVVLPRKYTGIKKIAFGVLYVFRCLLTALSIAGIAVNIIITLPITFLITALISLYYLIRGNTAKARKVWVSWGKGSWLMVKNSAVRSFASAKKILDPNISFYEWLPEMLNLVIDCNGELRNALSLANAVGALSSPLLGVILGPLRIWQGILVIAISGIMWRKMHNDLKDKTLHPIAKQEIHINIQSYKAYIGVGLLWVLMGSLSIAIAVGFAGAPPLWIILTMAVVTFLLFDLGFFTMSGFYIKQSLFAIKNYINPIEDLIKEIEKNKSPDLTIPRWLFSEETPFRVTSEIKIAMQKIFSTNLFNKLERLETLDDFEEFLEEMKNELEGKSAFNKYINIGLNALSQIGITLAGTPWDVAAIVDTVQSTPVPDNNFNDSIQDAGWVNQNTLCKPGDDSGITTAMTENEHVRFSTKTYTVAILALITGFLIAGDVVGGPALNELKPLFDMAGSGA